MNFKKSNKAKGFTLIEILVVIGIIAILASIVIIAINPARQFAQARNAQRTANVNAILNAVGQRIADNKGVFEGTVTLTSGATYNCGKLPATKTAITSDVATNTTTETGDLGCLVPTYIPTLPEDPTWSSGTDTLYKIQVVNARINVCAPLGAETALPGSTEICVIR